MAASNTSASHETPRCRKQLFALNFTMASTSQNTKKQKRDSPNGEGLSPLNPILDEKKQTEMGKGKEVVCISSSISLSKSSTSIITSVSQGSNELDQDLYDALVDVVADSNHKMKESQKAVSTPPPYRLIKCVVKSKNPKDGGYTFFLTGRMHFKFLYEGFARNTNYSVDDFTLYLGEKKVDPKCVTDELNLKDKDVLLTIPKKRNMNLDSRFNVLIMDAVVENEDGLRQLFNENEDVRAIND